MPANEPVEKKYDKAIRDSLALNPVFPYDSKLQMANMVEQIIKSNDNIKNFLSHKTTSSHRGGFIAEEFHAETFNLDSILKNKAYRAETGFDKNLISNNDQVVDIAVTDGSKIVLKAQSKFMQDAGTTSHKQSLIDKESLSPKYESADIALVPSDQVSAVREHATDSAARHRIKADNLADIDSNPLVERAHRAKADAYDQTAKKASGTIEHDGVKSTKLTKDEANTLGDGSLDKLEKTQSSYQTSSTLQHMQKAAVGAATMTAVVAGSINTLTYLKQVRDGKISTTEATIKIIGETAAAAADSALKASLITGAHSTLVRITGQATIVPLAQQTLGSMFRTNAVSAGVVCAVNAVKDLVLLAKGEITTEQFYERQGKGVLNTSAGMMGASLGVAALPAAGAAITMAPLLAGFAGGLIASVAMNFAVENGIEKPYREIVENTETLRDSAAILEDLSRSALNTQIAFGRFLQTEAELDFALKRVANQGTESTVKMRSAIDRL